LATMPNQEQKSESMEQAKDLIAGTMAGLLSKVIEYPFDTLKVRLQTTPEKYGNSAVLCLRKMIAEEGWRSIFRGLPAPLIGAMGENSVIFWSYGIAARFISGENTKNDLSLSQVGIAGLFSGVAVGTYLTPVEYIKCRLQAKSTSGMYTSTFDCFLKTIAHEGGVRVLFTGLCSTLARDVPGHAVYFVTYEAVSGWLTPENGQPAPAYAVIAGGSCSGIAYWCSIYPFDSVKSRIQTTGIVDSFGTVCVQEYQINGFAGLYRGLGVTLPRGIISNGLIFFAYEYSKRFLDSLL